MSFRQRWARITLTFLHILATRPVDAVLRVLSHCLSLILQLVPGSAAANSPLEVGEVIQSVNGTDCSYCSTDHLADLLLGPEGSVVNVLTIARGGRPKSINLERGLPWDEVFYLSIHLSVYL